MLKSASTLFIAAVLVLTPLFTFGQSQQQSDADAKRVQEIRAKVRGLSANGSPKVKIKMLDGTQREGELVSAGDTSFSIRNGSTDAAIAYADVRSVSRKSGFWNPQRTILIAAAAATAVVVLAVLGKRCANEGGC